MQEVDEKKNEQGAFINQHIFTPDQNLQEPIWTTVKRDLGGIFLKLRFTLFPFSLAEKRKELRNWDLFGPMLITIGLTM